MPERPGDIPHVPCWVDLWTSDVEASRAFYPGVFGWEALEAQEQFHGYFNFAREGRWTAGGMGPMDGMPATDTWKHYVRTPDIGAAVRRAQAAGAAVPMDGIAVGDLGMQAVVIDPTGAAVGLWQPGSFAGFAVVDEPGAPSWFELHTTDFSAAVAFYRDLFAWDVVMVSNTDEFRYATVRNPDRDEDLGGIADSRQWLGDRGSHWAVYWYVDDVDATLATVARLGGTVVSGPDDTPYGRLATATDPSSAEFKLRSLP